MKKQIFFALLMSLSVFAFNESAHAVNASCAFHAQPDSQTVAAQRLIEPPSAQPVSAQGVRFQPTQPTTAPGVR